MAERPWSKRPLPSGPSQQELDAPLLEAIELLELACPMHNFPGSGGIWFGNNHGPPDGGFTDWGVARAVAIVINAVVEGRLTIPYEGPPTSG